MNDPSAHLMSHEIVGRPTVSAVRRRFAAGILLLLVLAPAGYSLFPVVRRTLMGEGTLVIAADDRAVEVTICHPDGRSERMEVAARTCAEALLLPGDYSVRLCQKDGGAFAEQTVHLDRHGREVLGVADLLSRPGQSICCPFRFQGDCYEATVAADGALTSLRIAGVEMLMPGAFLSRDPSLAEQSSLPLPDVRCLGPAVIAARGEQAAIRYEFGPDTLNCDLSNTTDHSLSYSLVFRPEAAVVRGRGGRWARTPADKPWPVTTWFAGPARLEVRGGTRIWGPWKEHQVWEARLAPGETRRVVLTVGAPSSDEAARAAAIGAHEPARVVGSPGSLALVSKPAALPGVRRWALETRGPRSGVTAVAYRPDGGVLASSEDGAVRLWDAATGWLLRILVGHTGGVVSLAWSPDAALLASGSRDGTIRLWQAGSGRLLHTLEVSGGKPLRAIAWRPRSKVLASAGDDGLVRLWDTTSGRQLALARRHESGVWSLAWSPDGTTLATGGRDGKVCLWPADSSRPGRSWQASSQLIPSLAWSPDGQTLAAAGVREGVRGVSLWDVSSSRFLRRVDGTSFTAWSRDSQTLATISYGEVYLWEANTGQLRRNVGSHRGRASALAWSPDGKDLAIGSNPAIGIWKAESGEPVWGLAEETSWIYRATWSPDGKTLACGLLRPVQVQLWELETGRLAGILPDAWWAVWSPDGKRLAAGTEQEVSVWEARSLRRQGLLHPAPGFREVAWSPDNTTLATRSRNGVVQLWDASSYQLREPPQQHPAAGSVPARSREGRYVAWSHDGRLLASSGPEGMACIHDAESQRRMVTLQDLEGAAWDLSLAWSPESTLLAVGTYAGGATLWGPFLGEMLDSFTGHQGQVAVAWSADGSTLLTAGAGDNTVRRWDVRDGRLLSVVHGPGGFLAAFSPDTQRLVGHWGNSFRVWETQTGRVLATLIPLPGNEMVAVGASGHYAGPAGIERHLVYVIETDAGQELLNPEQFASRFGWKNDPRQATAPAKD